MSEQRKTVFRIADKEILDRMSIHNIRFIDDGFITMYRGDGASETVEITTIPTMTDDEIAQCFVRKL